MAAAASRDLQDELLTTGTGPESPKAKLELTNVNQKVGQMIHGVPEARHFHRGRNGRKRRRSGWKQEVETDR